MINKTKTGSRLSEEAQKESRSKNIKPEVLRDKNFHRRQIWEVA